MKEEPCTEIITEELAQMIIAAPKSISRKDYLSEMKPVRNNTYLVKTSPLKCEKYQCQMKIRQSVDNPLNFSIILLYRETNVIIRYNGSHGCHRNRLEKSTIAGPHIHMITERYQLQTQHPDGFAIPTEKYGNLYDALDKFMTDTNISISECEKDGGA